MKTDDLDDFGITEGISEVIGTTISKEGRFNAAPMGVACQGGDVFVMMFRDSDTFRNVQDTGSFCANVCLDPVLFVVSAFEDLETGFFEVVNDFPIISGCDAWVLFQTEPAGNDDPCRVVLTPVKGEIRNTKVRAINRGFNAVIEAAVLGTRYAIMGGEDIKEKISCHRETVLKCGTDRDKVAMGKLLGFLGF